MPSRRGRDLLLAVAASHCYLRSGCRGAARGHRRGRPDHHPESKLTQAAAARPRKEERRKKTAGRSALAAVRARVTIRHARKPALMGIYCVRDLNPRTREISPIRGNFHGSRITAGARGRQAFRVVSRFPGGGRCPGGPLRGARTQPRRSRSVLSRRVRAGEISGAMRARGQRAGSACRGADWDDIGSRRRAQVGDG